MVQRSWLVAGLIWVGTLDAASAIETVSQDPYIGAVVVNAADGAVVYEENADRVGYPASMVKLMDLLVILEKVEQGVLAFDDEVHVTAEAARMGGSQVYLAEHERFTINDLLYALMIQSANDAAVALAIHIAGSKEGFVELMNQKAKALGMSSTTFHSVHGLPPGKGQLPDVTTCHDVAKLCRELVKYEKVFDYTAEKFRGFRDNTFDMRTHNKLLHTYEGCDGLKTGYYRKAGFSMAATAERKGVRVITVILGSKDKNVRNAKAAEFLSKGFLAIPRPKEGVSTEPVKQARKTLL